MATSPRILTLALHSDGGADRASGSVAFER